MVKAVTKSQPIKTLALFLRFTINGLDIDTQKFSSICWSETQISSLLGLPKEKEPEGNSSPLVFRLRIISNEEP